ALKAPESGMLQQSKADSLNGVGWILVSGDSCLRHFVWSEPPGLPFASGQHLRFEHHDSAQHLDTEVREVRDQSLRLYIPECTKAGLPEGRWMWKQEVSQSASLWHSWRRWQVQTDGKRRLGKYGS